MLLTLETGQTKHQRHRRLHSLIVSSPLMDLPVELPGRGHGAIARRRRRRQGRQGRSASATGKASSRATTSDSAGEDGLSLRGLGCGHGGRA